MIIHNFYVIKIISCKTKDDSPLLIIYGKRRIGKTELIKQFIKEKPHVYYLAQRINEEIDLVAVNDDEKKILFGEAKWSKKPVGIDIYDNLMRKSRLVDWNKEERAEYFCLFSKSGFTDNLLKRAKKEKIALFQMDRFLEP